MGEPKLEPRALPCPFCGGPAYIQPPKTKPKGIRARRLQHVARHIGCKNDACLSPGITAPTAAVAIGYWNARTPSAPPPSPAFVAIANALRDLKDDDSKTALSIAIGICAHGIDLLALLGLPFSPKALALVVASAGDRAANKPTLLASFKKYRDEEAPQAVEQLRSDLAAEAASAKSGDGSDEGES